MGMYTAVLVTADELSQDEVIQLLERVGVVTFCGPGALVESPADDGAATVTRISAGGRQVKVVAEVTEDGPVVRLSGIDCDLEGEMPGEYYLTPRG